MVVSRFALGVNVLEVAYADVQIRKKGVWAWSN